VNHREASRQEWITSKDGPTRQEIDTGSLQRIADATEKMAENWDRLVQQRDTYKRMADEERECARRLDRRVNALRGVVTRMRNEAARVAALRGIPAKYANVLEYGSKRKTKLRNAAKKRRKT
jgi:uncharacterized protein YukE